MQIYTSADQVADLWRPLSESERSRAEALIGSAERAIRRRWDLEALVARGTVSEDDIADIVAWLVIPVLGGPKVPGAKSWQATSGSESRSVTLDNPADPRSPWELAGWMVAALDGTTGQQARAAVLPAAAFPLPRLDRIFGAEEYS